MSWLNATQVLSESDNELSQDKKWEIVGHLVIFDTHHEVKCGENKIGRDPSQCSIVLENNKTLSKVHAVIESVGPNDTFIYDEQSTNKTRLGKMMLKPHVRYKINDGDTIIFGNVVAKFKAASEADDSDIGSQSLLSPSKTLKENKNKQSGIVLESPSLSDSIFEANTQCRIDGAASSPDVFKTPQSVKSKNSQASNSSDIFSAATQNCLKSDDSDIYDQPTQCNFKTPERPSRKTLRKLDNSDVFEMATQCQINDSVYEQETQLPEYKFEDVFELETQGVSPAAKKLFDIFEVATQVPGQNKDEIFDAKTQIPNGKEELSDDDNIFDAVTQVPTKNMDVFDVDTQVPRGKGGCYEDSHIFEAATQVPSSCKKMITESETRRNGLLLVEDEHVFEMATQVADKDKCNIFEVDTQITKKCAEEDIIFEMDTQQPVKDNYSIFKVKTQQQGFSTSSPNKKNSSIFETETQCQIESSKKMNVSPDDSNEIIASLPDSIFEENTQVNHIQKKTPDSGRKSRKRPLKHDNVSLFKGKRRSAEDYLNDGQDDVLCEFMSQNSPAYEKKEKDVFEEEINLEEVPNHIFEMDTQVQKDNSHMDSGISDEKDDGSNTQIYSPNATANDSGVKDVKISIIEKGKKDSVRAKVSKNKAIKNSVNMVMSSSSDEDCDVTPENRALEDLVPTQVISQHKSRKFEDNVATQVLERKEDDIPTQLFKTEDNIPTQIFNHRVGDSSDDETDSDPELPKNKEQMKTTETIEDSATDSDVEIEQGRKINQLNILTSSSAGKESSPDNFEIDEASNNSFSMLNEGDNSPSLLKENVLSGSGSASINETNTPDIISQRKIVEPLQTIQRNLSPTQVMSEEDLFDDKNEDMEVSVQKPSNLRPKRTHACSPTQVMSDLSDAETDCGDISVKKESNLSFDETQVLPLSPPPNYEPRVLNSQDAWMVGKDTDSGVSTPKRKKTDEDDWGPLSLEMPSTQEFERTAKERSVFVSPEKPVSSKRVRDFEDLDTSRSKLKKESPPIFKAPKNLFADCGDNSGEISLGPSVYVSQRPSRIRKPPWKEIFNDEEDENSPVFKTKQKKNKAVISDDESEDEDSPLVKLPNQNKSKPMIFEDNMLSQVYEDERNIPKRRSARIQKSQSNTSCNSSDFDFSTKRKRGSQIRCKKTYFTSDVKIIFTGYENENQTRIIEELDGEKITDLKEANVVVTDKVRRTVKFLSALALGLPIVGPSWLLKCNDEMEFIDPWPYLLQDKEAEDKYGFNLKGSLTKAKKKKMLDGYSIFATENVKPPVPELMSIVQCCGGKPLRETPDIWPEKTIIISCPEDEKFWPPAAYRYIKIVHYEFLLTGVLKQTLEFKTFKLR